MSKSDSSSIHRKSKTEASYLHDVDSDSKLRGLDDKDAAITHAHTQHITTEQRHSSDRFKHASESFIDAVPHHDEDDDSFASYVHAEPIQDDDALDSTTVHESSNVVHDSSHVVHGVHQKDSKLIKDIEPEYIDVDVIEDDDNSDLAATDSSDDELAKLEQHFKSSFASEFTDTEAIEPNSDTSQLCSRGSATAAAATASAASSAASAGSAAHGHMAAATGTAIIRHPDDEAKDASAAAVADADKVSGAGRSHSLSTKGQSLAHSAKHGTAVGESAAQGAAGAGAGVDADEAGDFDVFSQVKKFNAQHDGYDLDDNEHEEELDLESSSYGNFEDEEDNEAETESDSFTSNENGMHVFEHDGHSSLDDEDEEDDSDYGSATPNLPVTHEGGHKKQSTALVKSSASGGIGAFIKAANMVPMLTDEEEIELTRRFREEGDLSAARRLVESHLRLVIKEARGFTGYGLPLSDLIQEGNIGLMKAVKRFEPDKGARLSTFSRTYILSEIYEYIICNWRMVKVATTKAQRKILFNLNKFKNELRRFTASERQDVAATLGVSATDVAEMEKRLSGSDIGFDPDEADSAEKGVAVAMSPSAYLEDESSDFASTYEQTNYAAWEMKKLREALNSLDDRSRYIIKRRWLDEDKATLQELSNEFKVSIERVRQIEANAMGKVKAILLNEGVSADEYSDATALEDKSSKRKTKRAVTTRRNQTARSASTQLKRHAAAGSGVKALPHKKSAHTIKGEEINAKITGTALTEPLKKKRGRKKATTATTETVRSGSSTISGSESTALLPAPKSSSRSN